MSGFTAPTWRVRASPLGPSFDLLASPGDPAISFEHGGMGVASAALAASGAIELPIGAVGSGIADAGREVLALLRSFEPDGDGPSTIAMGALGFRGGGGALHVPRRVVRRTTTGRTWLVESGPRDEPLPPFVPRPARVGRIPHEAFTELQLVRRPEPGGYAEAVRAAAARIREGHLRKVVLARQIEVRADRALDPALLAARLRSVDPDAYTFVAPITNGALVGASPELLVSRRGAEVRSNPLAGSAPRSGDPEEDRQNGRELERSSKDREEHAIVVEAVAEALGPFCERLAWDPEPVLLPTANVWHLSTRFAGRLRAPAADALALVAALHPTPAVGGSPREAALTTIRGLEPFDRGAYAGPVGWIDAEGDGEWAVALRCAEIVGERATLYAGAGIVGGSDPDAEVEETERKFRAFLDALRWG
jgi:isochorismate synthase